MRYWRGTFPWRGRLEQPFFIIIILLSLLFCKCFNNDNLNNWFMEMLFLLLLLICCLFESAFRWRFAPCRRQSTYSGFNVAQLFLLINHFYFILKNFKIKITICLHKNDKTKTTNKQTSKWNKHHKKQEKEIPFQHNPFFRKIFHIQFSCFYLKILLRKHKLFMLWNNVIYYVPFPCKINCFLWIRSSNFFLYSFYFSNFSYELFFSEFVHI